MSEAVNIPQLRFPEFSGEWEESRLGDVSTNIMYGIGSAATKYDGVNKYLRITDINDSSRNFVPKPLTSPEGFINDSYKLSDGDIVFARTGASVGKSYLYKASDGNLIFAGFLIKFNISNADPYFVYSNTFRSTYDNWISVMSVRSGQPGLNAEEYKLLPISLPTKPEQQKIAAFLTAVDNKIEQLSKKQKLLGEYKKGLMQQIFSQAIRFKADDGSDFPDWEEKKLRNVLSSVSTRPYQIKSADILEFGSHKVVDQGQKELAGYTNEKDKLLTNDGVIVYGDHTTIVKFINYDFVVGADGVKLLTSDSNNIKYLYFNLLFNNVGPEGYKRHFSILKNVVLQIPSLPEQNKIANFLSSIDSKIEQVGKQLNESKQFKKALLQQMFV